MPVASADFVTEMARLWTQDLGNHCNDGFRLVWSKMADTFIEAIKASMSHDPLLIQEPPPWLVLSPEMGVGKTFGTCLYLGMMAREIRKHPPPLQLGAMFACRTIRQCEEAVSSINRHAGYTAAITRHSENEATVDDVYGHPVLVITHAALTNGDDGFRNRLLKEYLTWQGGDRVLTVIDEALVSATTVASVTVEKLQYVLSQIPPDLKAKHLQAHEFIKLLHDRLVAMSSSQNSMAALWRGLGPHDKQIAEGIRDLFTTLVSDLRKIKRNESNSYWNDPQLRKMEIAKVADILDAIVLLFRRWATYVKKGREVSAAAGEVRLPRLWCPVLLNATAGQDILLDYLGATLVPLPRVRNYRNLTLRVLRQTGLGKEAMKQNATARMQRLGQFIRSDTAEGDHWLVVVHKDTEAVAQLHLPSHSCTIAHWGALDGLNDYRDCNKVVLFGLSYRDPAWALNLHTALAGSEYDANQLDGERASIRRDLESKAMAAQIIQALGRPQSRKVCDSAGNCLPTTAYLTLPDDSIGRAIETYIRSEFTGLHMEHWQYSIDSAVPTEWTPRNANAALVSYLKGQPPGRYSVSDVVTLLELQPKEIARIKDALKKGRGLVDQLSTIGVTYVSEGRGRSAKTYLTKH
ncbi:hypothetical protein DK847_09130 [Aestuariivirga litoralis]|uniref:Uncharacterized protein n=1 Tax=Aestuariivirga litoralis TaxID=2650924 RepID=A0A2W2BMK7_9HYPH|nr:hypothetical protein [Aestuariivirga litoralis]PZF77469.1 hypothetical protein DK847_09130 [Aestuariivirga litoralis]